MFDTEGAMKKILFGLMLLVCISFMFVTYGVQGESSFQHLKSSLSAETISFQHELTEEERVEILELAEMNKVNLSYRRATDQSSPKVLDYVVLMNNMDLFKIMPLKFDTQMNGENLHDFFNHTDGVLNTTDASNGALIDLPLLKNRIQLTPYQSSVDPLPKDFHIYSYSEISRTSFLDDMKTSFGAEVFSYEDGREGVNIITLSIKELFSSVFGLLIFSLSLIMMGLNQYANLQRDEVLVKHGYTHFKLFTIRFSGFLKQLGMVSTLAFIGVILVKLKSVNYFLIFKSYFVLVNFYLVMWLLIFVVLTKLNQRKQA